MLGCNDIYWGAYRHLLDWSMYHTTMFLKHFDILSVLLFKILLHVTFHFGEIDRISFWLSHKLYIKPDLFYFKLIQN